MVKVDGVGDVIALVEHVDARPFGSTTSGALSPPLAGKPGLMYDIGPNVLPRSVELLHDDVEVTGRKCHSCPFVRRRCR